MKRMAKFLGRAGAGAALQTQALPYLKRAAAVREEARDDLVRQLGRRPTEREIRALFAERWKA
jgi:hypothetical protein